MEIIVQILLKLIKSKTVDFNILVPIITAVLSGMGLSVPSGVIIAVLTIGNFILRLLTKVPITEK